MMVSLMLHTESRLKDAEMLAISRALSDPVRLQMLRLLAQRRPACCEPASLPPGCPPEGICVCEFVEQLDIIQSRASYHLKVLREAKLVQEQVCGRWNFYRLNRITLQRYLAALQQELLS